MNKTYPLLILPLNNVLYREYEEYKNPHFWYF